MNVSVRSENPFRLDEISHAERNADFFGGFSTCFDILRRDRRIDDGEDDLADIGLYVSGKFENRRISGFSELRMAHFVICIRVGGIEADRNDVEQPVEKGGAVLSVDQLRLTIGVETDFDVGNAADMAADRALRPRGSAPALW